MRQKVASRSARNRRRRNRPGSLAILSRRWFSDSFDLLASLVAVLAIGTQLALLEPGEASGEQPIVYFANGRNRVMSRWKVHLIAGMTSAFFLVSGAVTLAAPGELNDLDISLAVENELMLEPAIPTHNIDVSVEQGVVTLSGSVDTYAAMLDAQDVAESIKGVEAVVNSIEVKPRKVADLAIRSRILSALALNPVTESYEIRVEVVDGEVTLTGKLDSRSEMQAAQDVVADVPGVTRVVNQLSYVFVENRLDKEVAADIRYRLRSDASIDSRWITVAVDRGDVMLTGRVRSAAEKSEAEQEAWFVPGVKSVKNEIDIAWQQRQDVNDHGDNWSDRDVKKMLDSKLLANPWVNRFDITTIVRDGVATLTGTVDNLQAKRKAELEALDVSGIRRVKNFLRVRPTRPRTDADVAKEIRQTLEQDPHVSVYDITVSVFGGKAYLRGEVDSVYMKQQAEEAAMRVPGVVDIRNALRVHYQATPKSDQEIEEDIKSELFWSPFVDSDDITVEVHSGVATVTGNVEDWSEMRAVQENVRQGGATSMINMLEIVE
jgi:osmotically-inducible protein OsmY